MMIFERWESRHYKGFGFPSWRRQQGRVLLLTPPKNPPPLALSALGLFLRYFLRIHSDGFSWAWENEAG
jgi:hypothetical protein